MRYVLSTARQRILATRSATGGWARNRLSSHPTRPDANSAAVGRRRLWRAGEEGTEPSADAIHRRAWASQGQGQLCGVPTAGGGSPCSKSGKHHGLKRWLRMPRCWKRELAVAPSECASPGERGPPIPRLDALSPSPDLSENPRTSAEAVCRALPMAFENIPFLRLSNGGRMAARCPPAHVSTVQLLPPSQSRLPTNRCPTAHTAPHRALPGQGWHDASFCLPLGAVPKPGLTCPLPLSRSTGSPPFVIPLSPTPHGQATSDS
jgi:hypothetical protein